MATARLPARQAKIFLEKSLIERTEAAIVAATVDVEEIENAVVLQGKGPPK